MSRSGSPPADRRSISPATKNHDMRERSRSPPSHRRSQSPGPERKSEPSVNPGTNLFVTGLALKLREEEIKTHFGQFGKVDKVQILYDPHTRDSRGFGFVSFFEQSAAASAMEALNGAEFEGKKLMVELAKRGRPRTPTPGQYYGPPKSRRADDEDRRGRYEPRYPRDDRVGRHSYDRYGPPPRDYYADRERGYGGRERYDYRDDYRRDDDHRRMDRSYDDRREYDRRDRYDAPPPRAERMYMPPPSRPYERDERRQEYRPRSPAPRY